MKNKLITLTALSLLIGLYACCSENCNCDTSQNTLVQDTTKEQNNVDVGIDTASVNVQPTEITMEAVIKNYNVGSADASNVGIMISLPAETQIRSFVAVTNKNRVLNWRQCGGIIYVDTVHIIRCNWSNTYDDNDARFVKIKLVTGRTKLSSPEQFAVYAYDKVLPDVKTVNNYWHWGTNENKSTCVNDSN